MITVKRGKIYIDLRSNEMKVYQVYQNQNLF